MRQPIGDEVYIPTTNRRQAGACLRGSPHALIISLTLVTAAIVSTTRLACLLAPSIQRSLCPPSTTEAQVTGSLPLSAIKCQERTTFSLYLFSRVFSFALVVPGTGYSVAYMRKKMYGYFLYLIAWLSFSGLHLCLGGAGIKNCAHPEETCGGE